AVAENRDAGDQLVTSSAAAPASDALPPGLRGSMEAPTREAAESEGAIFGGRAAPAPAPMAPAPMAPESEAEQLAANGPKDPGASLDAMVAESRQREPGATVEESLERAAPMTTPEVEKPSLTT